ncbi:MAG: hypothetical protein ABH824_02200 [Nanoarchaeota archaeon]|nr:hypothetical protein [Nanoarchaeota archaeon]MBU1632189.1 hypothetical protein [Nanoarchaeota archaeon]MBU1875590.1 hypothetical protein [Nanoarchaeota archaeon]
MDLKELKKETQKLDNIKEDIENFQENWVKVIKSNTNKKFPFLKNISADVKKEINTMISELQNNINQIKYDQAINEKLRQYSYYLIELKLTTLNGNKSKSQFITNQLINDDFFKLQNTINDIKLFEENVKKLSGQYDEINMLLQKELSLDEALYFMEHSHKIYLNNLIKTSQKQKNIVRHLGRHFISLAKETGLVHKQINSNK